MKKILPFVSCLLLISGFSFANEFIRGVDISTHNLQLEREGKSKAVIYHEQGRAKDLFSILKNHNVDWVRIRLFHSPQSDSYGTQMDLTYVTELAKKVKAKGFKFLLDIHYSDSWADPGQQTIPKAWRGMNHKQLVSAVDDYTFKLIRHLRLNKVLPDMVQIGNETTGGMLWPVGKIGEGNWREYTELVKSAIKGLKRAYGNQKLLEIMIHIDRGGDKATTKWFFDNLIDQGVEFDIIGQSFYPEWHGSLDDLSENLKFMSENYKQDIVLVEVGDYYKAKPGASPASQKHFLQEVIKRVIDNYNSISEKLGVDDEQ